MSHLKCGDITDSLLEFVAGRLDGAARARVDAHLEACSACREFVDAHRAVWQSLDAWEAPPVSPDFDQRLYARIAAERSWWDRLLEPVRFATRHRWPIAAAAGVIIVAGIAVNRYALPDRSGPASQPSISQAARQGASIQLESLRPDQADAALRDLEMMHEISESPAGAPAAPPM
ncbi:MAG TPA: zf-HC2 domain-containing protein [Bryobacteraceae bacterium]|nr:zf-HC2 domain-containing protein [Bryobacteraceae bacterium]